MTESPHLHALAGKRILLVISGGIAAYKSLELIRRAPERPIFEQMIFSKIVPNCRKLGLLDANGGWLRERFTDLGVIQFEHWEDTGEEYDMFALAEGNLKVKSA